MNARILEQVCMCLFLHISVRHLVMCMQEDTLCMGFERPLVRGASLKLGALPEDQNFQEKKVKVSLCKLTVCKLCIFRAKAIRQRADWLRWLLTGSSSSTCPGPKLCWFLKGKDVWMVSSSLACALPAAAVPLWSWRLTTQELHNSLVFMAVPAEK